MVCDYGGTRDAIRKRFGVGKTAAEQIIKRAHEVLRRDTPEGSPEVRATITRFLLNVAESAAAEGKWRDATRAAAVAMRVNDTAPERIEVTTKTEISDMEDLSNEELALLSRIADKRRADDDGG
jgi:hypothetical protein